MTAFRLAAPLVLFAAACAPACSYASVQVAQATQSADTLAPDPAAAHAPQYAAPTRERPVLSVGVSDPDTQLILPWFLTDIINAINSRASAGDLRRTLGHDL